MFILNILFKYECNNKKENWGGNYFEMKLDV